MLKLCIKQTKNEPLTPQTDDVESWRKLLILFGLWITWQMKWNPNADEVESEKMADEVESSLINQQVTSYSEAPPK